MDLFSIRILSFQYLLALVAHPLQASAGGIDAGGETALEHGHREADGPAGSRVGGLRLDRLVLNVSGQRVVKVPLVAIDLERHSLDDALGEQLLALARVRVREADKGFLCAPEVERR